MSLAETIREIDRRGKKQAQTRAAEFKPATRVHGSLLAGVEKRALVWMAQRMPRWVNSDHLTALGSAALLMCGICSAVSRWWTNALVLANFFLVVNWFGDSLDGTLARVRDQQRPRYGFYVDHIADAFGAAALLGGLSVSGYMTPVIALALLAAFLLISIEVYLATYVFGSFHISFWRIGPTEMRIALIAGNFALLGRPEVALLGYRWALYDFAGVIAAVGLAATAAISAARHASRLYCEERLPGL
jgi:archaetidylinositol phosphate synthase